MSGSLPDLGNLANLEYLNLHDNQLSGPIPDLGNLANLISLTLSYNDLSGPIPDLSALSELTSLHLNNNRLSGPVPDLSALANLKYLSLHDNELTGPLPDLSVLPDLQSATFSGNQFCLLPGASLSHPNRNVNANLQRLNLPPCTGAELAAVPAAPQNLSATVAASQVTLRWDAAANAAGYDLWVWDSLDRQWGANRRPPHLHNLQSSRSHRRAATTTSGTRPQR